jgi:hypothetical protein
VADVAEDVRKLHSQARAVAGDQPPKPLGACIAPGCGGVVFPARLRDPDGSNHGGARCKRCELPYTGLDLVRLNTRSDTASKAT